MSTIVFPVGTRVTPTRPRPAPRREPFDARYRVVGYCQQTGLPKYVPHWSRKVCAPPAYASCRCCPAVFRE